MGLLQLVGSLKTWVSFAKETYKRDCILYSAKETCNFKGPTNHSHPIVKSSGKEGSEEMHDNSLVVKWSHMIRV